MISRDLHGYPSVHGAVFSIKYKILRRGSVRFKIFGNLTVRFGAGFWYCNPTLRFDFEIYPTVRFGAVFRYYCESYGAIRFWDKSYSAVRCGFQNSEMLRCGSVRF